MSGTKRLPPRHRASELVDDTDVGDVDGVSASSGYPRRGWRRWVRTVLRLWYVGFLLYPGNVLFNLLQLVANSGFAALQDPNNIEQLLLIHLLLQILTRQPLLVIPALVMLGILTLAGHLAQRDLERELEVLEERKLTHLRRELEEGAQATVREGIENLYAELPVLSPEAQTAKREGPPFDTLPTASHFVGRTQELKDLIERLRAGATTSIVAVEGIGGIGKTALAAEAIHFLRAEGAFPGGIAVVLAQNKTHAVLVLREALARFDPQGRQPPGTTVEDLARTALRLLGGKTALVVIDNVEPGLNIEQVVKPLASAGATVLLTARQDLPVGVAFHLDVLAAGDAVELFAQEYGAGSVDDLLPSQRELIERIVNALGRHALAIKLAARYAGDSNGPDLGELAGDLENPQGVLGLPGVSSPGIGRESMEVVFYT